MAVFSNFMILEGVLFLSILAPFGGKTEIFSVGTVRADHFFVAHFD
jgi:hypothetical protein